MVVGGTCAARTTWKRLALGLSLVLAVGSGLSCAGRKLGHEMRVVPSPAVPPKASAPARPTPLPGPAAAATSAPCAAFAHAYCDRLEHCAPHQLRAQLGTAADCREAWTSYCSRTQSLSGSGFGDEQARRCGAALSGWECAKFRPWPDLLIPACHPAGAHATGDRCLDDRQCQTGYCLHALPEPSECGVCAPRAPANGECWNGVPGSARQGCQLGETCSRGSCLGPLKNEGEPCGVASPWTSDCYGDEPTGEWLVCQGPPTRPDSVGVCRRYETPTQQDLNAPGEGAACDEDFACRFPYVCAGKVCRLTDPSCR